jgi:hypothetical protein
MWMTTSSKGALRPLVSWNSTFSFRRCRRAVEDTPRERPRR